MRHRHDQQTTCRHPQDFGKYAFLKRNMKEAQRFFMNIFLFLIKLGSDDNNIAVENYFFAWLNKNLST